MPPPPRLDSHEVAPEGVAAMLGLERYVCGSALPHRLLELVQVRARQINGCAYCHVNGWNRLAVSFQT